MHKRVTVGGVSYTLEVYPDGAVEVWRQADNLTLAAVGSARSLDRMTADLPEEVYAALDLLVIEAEM